MKKVRRCQEDREDFTFEADKGPWPMYVHKGGELYSFCPGKATWDHDVVDLYRLLVIGSTTGVMLESGGLLDQPEWWVENLSWFAPRFDEYKFNSRMMRVLGDGKVKSLIGGPSGSNRRPTNKNPG